MPKEQTNLTDFSFDDSVEFFGNKTESTKANFDEVAKSGTSKQKATEIKSVETEEDNIEEADDSFVFEAPKSKATKVVAKIEPEEEKDLGDDDDDEDEEEVKKPKKKVKEDIEEGEEEEEEVKPKKKVVKEEKEEEDSEEKTELFYTTLAEEMIEQGVLQNIKLKKGEAVSEERFFELHNEEIEARVDETFEALAEDMDEDGKRFLQFKRNGGKTSDFIQAFRATSLPAEFNPEDPNHIETVLKHHIRAVEKLDEEDAEERLKYIQDTGKSVSMATKFYIADKKAEDVAKEQLLKNQAENFKKKQLEDRQFNEELIDILGKTDKVGIFPITKTDKRELNSYITKATVKIGKDQYVPQLQYELSQILVGKRDIDKKRLLILAKLVKNKFDTTDLAIEVQTKVTQKAKSRLMEAKSGNPRPTTSGVYGKKSLTDFDFE